MQGVRSLYVINKAGSLIFQRSFGEDGSLLTQNDYLTLASTFQAMQLMVTELSPVGNGSGFGMETLETSNFLLQAFASPTGVQFFVTAALKTEKLAEFLREAYVLYADYIMKNPFYQIDMPIKCELWDIHLKELVDRYNRSTA